MKKKENKYCIYIVAIVAIVAVVGLVIMISGGKVVTTSGDIFSEEDLTGQAYRLKIDTSVYDTMKTEFAEQGLDENEMIKRIARSDIIYSDIMIGIRADYLNTNEDVNLIYPAVQLVNIQKKIDVLNAKSTLSSSERQKLRSYNQQAEKFKQEVAASLFKIYSGSQSQTIKNTAFLVANEDMYKSNVFGLSLNTLSTLKMPFGSNMEGIFKGKDGKGKDNSGLSGSMSGGRGGMSVPGSKEEDTNKKSPQSFAACVSEKLHGTGGAPGTPGGAGGTINPGVGMSGEAGGFGGAKGTSGGLFAQGGGHEGYGEGPTSGVDMSNICGGETGVWYEQSKNPKDHSWKVSSGWKGKQWSIEFTATKVNSDGSIEGKLTVQKPGGKPKSFKTKTLDSTQNNKDMKAAMREANKEAKASCTGACIDPKPKPSPPKDKGDPNKQTSESKESGGSKGYNPEGVDSNCGQSVADCFESKSGNMGCTAIDIMTGFSSKININEGSPPGFENMLTVFDIDGLKSECGCLSLTGIKMAGPMGQGAPVDMPQESLTAACGGNKGKALELANTGLFFTDPSPMMKMSGTQMSATMQEGLLSEQATNTMSTSQAISKGFEQTGKTSATGSSMAKGVGQQ
ncbi:MAG: hypothetical protein ABIG89_02010 [Candidatus Woesearchaeota archaeon]